jgi:hypothetical protein
MDSTRRISGARIAVGLTITLALPWDVSRGQALLAEWTSGRGRGSEEDQFGNAVSWLGDVDGDGVVDALVAASHEDVGGNQYAGAGYVLSGATGAVIRKHGGDDAGGRLGMEVAGGSDFDGDGVPAYGVGSFLLPFDSQEGTVYVYSGASGSLLYTFIGEDRGDALGVDLCIVGDVDGDGVDDLGMGAPTYDNGSTVHAGRAYVYSGANGSLLFTVTGVNSNEHLGRISGIGDVDWDGRPDVCIGSPSAPAVPSGAGKIGVYSGATGVLFYELEGESSPKSSEFGRSCGPNIVRER